ncbi:transposase [Saccharopolyspora spinosa]|uniref:transposase n=1 Tax=Saccharopolyspora spinosa TaxID=60894 RepID=UPI00193381C5|nr:transposase [Saccharopolyspora spinosa]
MKIWRRVYGDAAYGTGELLERLDGADIYKRLKVQPPAAAKGHFPKDRFDTDLDTQTVTCPAGHTAPIRARERHAEAANFGAACAACSPAAQCTTAKTGRTITITAREAALQAGRARQTDPAWRADYRATCPKVERGPRRLR